MKDEVISKIILSIADDVSIDIGELKSKLYIAMNGYNVSLESTEIVVREENKNEWLFKKFIMTKTVQGLTERTLGLYSIEIPKILSKIGKLVEEITSDDILYYLAIRECKDKCTKVTCKNELRYLSSFLGYLFVEGYIPTNPVRKIGTIKLEKKKMKAFSDIEVAKIRQGCKNSKEKAIIELFLSTGCRVSELVNIKKVDIEINKVIVKGKGNKERIVYLNATAILAVEAYIKDLPELKNPYLFPKMNMTTGMKKGIARGNGYLIAENYEEGHMDKASVEDLVRRLGKRVGVTGVHPHRFRRTCATMALKRGMPIEQVSKMLGHEQLTTTQIYLDLNERDLEIAHEKYVL